MPYDVGVNSYLQGKGVSNGDIGYDQNSGNVTVRGQNFYKPELNMAGTAYSSQNNLDNAYQNYSKSLPVIQPDGSTGTTANTGQSTPASNPKVTATSNPTNGGYSNPYTSMIADVMKHLTDTYNAPQQDIYSSPQYAAAKANQDRQSADAIRHASESAAGAGLGHSTVMTDRTQHIQNDSDNYLATQLVPQIQAQMQAQRQQEIQNQQNQLNNYMNLGQQADSQHNADRTYDAGRQDAATAATGIFNPSGKSVQEIQSQMDANSKAYATATPEEQQRLHEENVQLGGVIGKTYDPNSGTYSQGQGYAGTKTIQSKQLDNQVSEYAYQHARDSLLDKRYEVKFNQDIKQQGFENALKIAVQQHQISNDNAQLAISRNNQSTNENRLAWEKDPNNPTNVGRTQQNNTEKINALLDVWKTSGKAPAGLESLGIKQGQDVYDKGAAQKEISDLYKQWNLTGKAPAGIPGVAEGALLKSASAKSELSGKLAGYATQLDILSPSDQKAALQGEKDKIIKETSIADYQKLYNTYFDSFGNPK